MHDGRNTPARKIIFNAGNGFPGVVVTTYMKKLILFSLIASLSITGCKKDRDVGEIRGTVIQKGGCFTDSWLVEVHNPQAAQQYFCEVLAGPPPGYNCLNALFIVLPPSLAEAGKDIRFNIHSVQSTCLSSPTAPVNAVVRNLTAD